MQRYRGVDPRRVARHDEDSGGAAAIGAGSGLQFIAAGSKRAKPPGAVFAGLGLELGAGGEIAQDDGGSVERLRVEICQLAFD
jgi:hypothetical protein